MAVSMLTGAQRLEERLSDPVKKREIAELLEISLGTVYESLRQFDAARIAGDIDEMRRHVPCIHRGGNEQKNGTFKGGRYIVPRDAFIRWYVSAGLAGEVLDELYGAGVP